MNRSTYLELPEVKEFVAWLSEVINDKSSKSFEHSYKSERNGQWHCDSLFNAFEKYDWKFSYLDLYTGEDVKGVTYIESENALTDLHRRLIKAVKEGDNDACFKTCSMILKWGGVLGRNRNTLQGMQEYLASYLFKVQEYFNGNCELSSRYLVKLNRGNTDIKMNSGFTKIYSLLCKNFIIYDSRVGAALGKLVVDFLASQNSKYRTVPSGLDFYYGIARNSNVNRNPSTERYKLKALRASSPVHIRNNIKANWIVSALDLSNALGFSKQTNPIRSFEAALFMVGYRV